jgi:recombination protein RecA
MVEPCENDAQKKKAMDVALAQIEKAFGRGAVMQLGQSKLPEVSSISTGALSIDLALGVGGLPRGRITEIYGTESSGKTTIALHVVAEAQKAGGLALFVDAEHALDIEYARRLGVDIEALYIAQPATGEEALEIMDAVVRSGAVDICVLDSVAALVPKAEIEGEMGDAFVGVQARLMSQALRKLGGSVHKSNTAAVFINQLREKIGVMYGNPEVTPGGRALKFWASVRMEIRRGEIMKRGTEQYGARTKIKIVKNKVAPPFRTAEVDLLFGTGVSRSGDIIDVGLDMGVISKTGTYYNYGEVRLGQGRDNARVMLDSNPEMMDEIDRIVRAKVKEKGSWSPGPSPVVEVE